MSPARQERYSLTRKLTDGDKAAPLAAYDAVVAVMRQRPTRDEGIERIEAANVPFRELPGLEFMFEDPFVGIFGAADKLTPPEESVAALHAAARPELLQVEVYPEGDHRLHHTAARRASSTAISTGSPRSCWTTALAH